MVQSHHQRRADRAAADFRSALAALAAIEKRKGGYSPDQPRVPAGNGRGSGEWARFMDGVRALAVQGANTLADDAADMAGRLVAPFRPAVDALAGALPPQAQQLLRDNAEAVQRTLGAVQAIGGGAQIAQGVELVEVGGATLPEGAPLLVAGAVLTAHGADDVGTGLRILATGQAQPGGFYTMLREAGLNDNAAQLALASASGIPVIAAAHVPLDVLQTTAEATLERDSLITLFSKGKVITDDGSSAFATRGIDVIGDLTERDALRLDGGLRTGPTFKTFDILVARDDGTFRAISVKSLNAKTDRYLQSDPGTMLPRIKNMIDDVANFTNAKGRLRDGNILRLTDADISERQLDLYLPAGVLVKGQHAQVETARAYARRRSVHLVVRYVH